MSVANLKLPPKGDMGCKIVPLGEAAMDRTLAEWAESYGDQTEQDHATLVDSIKRGKTKARIEAINEG